MSLENCQQQVYRFSKKESYKPGMIPMGLKISPIKEISYLVKSKMNWGK